jgi:hypothetical protein
VPDPSIELTRSADRLDRMLTRIPGVARFSELALIHARRVEPPSLDSAR